ncbi:MAG: hypothetical protein AB1599_07135 [Planctomycetota bacterium]
MNKFRTLIVLFLGYLVFFGVILAQENPKSAPEPAPQPKRTDVTDPDTIRRLELHIARLRGLDFKKDLKVGVKQKDELKSKMIEQAAKEPPEEYEKVRKALVKLGFIPADLKLRDFMIDLYAEQIGGFYDPQEKELYVVPARDPASEPPDQFGIPWNIIATVHEMTHALQDQNFDLLTLPMEEQINDDLATAVKALVEGEASFVMYDYALRQRGFDLSLLPPGLFDNPDPTPFSDRSLIDRAPLYIKEGMMFPYLKGLEFVKYIKARGGWEEVDKIYSDLPASTEQIIHPEKYYVERDYPTAITIPDLTGVLTTSRWTLLLDNVMGELNIGILKKQFYPTFSSKRMSEGWDGDEFILWDDHVTKHVLLVWFSAWDSEKDSREFFNAYQKIIARKYNGSSDEFPKPQLKTKEFSKVVWKLERPATDTGNATIKTNLISIEQRGADVLVIEDIPDDLLDKVSPVIWDKVDRQEYKEVKRVAPRKPEGKEEEKKPEEGAEKDKK